MAEVLVALGVAAVTILTLAGYIVSIHRAAEEGEGQALASIIARSILEEVRSNQALFDTVVGGTYSITQNEVLHPEEDQRTPRVFFVEVRGTLPSPELMDAVVQVDWREGQRNRKVILQSRFPRPPN